MAKGSTIIEHMANLAICVLVLAFVAIKDGPSRVGPFIDAVCFGNDD